MSAARRPGEPDPTRPAPDGVGPDRAERGSAAAALEKQRIVSAGYDEVADAYLRRFGVSAVRQRWLGRFTDGLPAPGARVLDLGCGAGIPVARDLAAAGHDVTGVDGSHQQIARARRNVPLAAFIEDDMGRVAFEAGGFDGVCAFYAMNHIPPARQAALLAGVSAWLKPGGVFVASFGAGTAGEWTGDWLGTTMFFGHSGEEATLGQLAGVGLRVRRAVVEKQDDEDAAFLWVEARRAR